VRNLGYRTVARHMRQGPDRACLEDALRSEHPRALDFVAFSPDWTRVSSWPEMRVRRCFGWVSTPCRGTGPEGNGPSCRAWQAC
jgi:hypothetical protein